MKRYFLICVLATLWQNPIVAQRTAERPAQSPVKDAKQKNPYLRIVYDDNDDPVAMETSIVTFQHPNKPEVTVDLIGAVHVADKTYFKKLNREFRKYDALLYELVAPKENNVPNDGVSKHPVGQMQQGLKSMLGLAYQLEEVDYSPANFVHADMSPEEFSRVMNERGESFIQMMFRAMGAALAKQSSTGRSSDFELLFAFGASDRDLRLKRILSTQFEDLEDSMKAIEGENGSTIIGQRNKKALDVLEREMAAGKKRIGIFYGAGHFPDMEKRLAKRFGLTPKPKATRWLTAWDMHDK